MADRYPYNIPVGFHFRVKVKGYESAAECTFSEVSGLAAKLDVESVREGGVNNFVHKLPKRVNYENLVLKRGLMKGSDLIGWVTKAIHDLEFTPSQVVVTLLDADDQPTVAWTLENAYPVAMRASEFKASENALVFETLELAYQFFTKEDQ